MRSSSGAGVVRAAAALDAGPWAELRSRLWPEADPAQLLEETRAFSSGGGSILAAAFVAEDAAGRLTGFIELALRAFSDGCESMPVPHVEGWYVEPFARGRGEGRRLMSSAEDWARARGFVEIASDTQLDNEASLRIHEACGFAEVERLIKLRKTLAPK